MIVFVGDKPSAKNLDPKVPFVGTQSYKRLLEWIWEMDIDISNVRMSNKDNLAVSTDDRIPNFWFLNQVLWAYTLENSKFVALGNLASNKLKELNIVHYKLPHPSGLNRKVNDKNWLKEELKKCKEWLNK